MHSSELEAVSDADAWKEVKIWSRSVCELKMRLDVIFRGCLTVGHTLCVTDFRTGRGKVFEALTTWRSGRKGRRGKTKLDAGMDLLYHVCTVSGVQ